MVRSPSFFDRLAGWAARESGRPIAFVLAVLLVLVWLITGPIFKFNDTWQLVINTTTTIITFFMVFLIQNTQTRDTMAMHVKLDELIRATQGAHNALLDLEELSEDELNQVRANYECLAQKAREKLKRGKSDVGKPRVTEAVTTPPRTLANSEKG